MTLRQLYKKPGRLCVQKRKENHKMNNTMTETGTMSFSAFTEEAVKRVRERYAGYEVKKSTVRKNNGLRLTGISILPPDTEPSRGISVFPMVYLDGLYTEYREGTPMEEIVDLIADTYTLGMKDPCVIPDLRQFGTVKDTICFRLINAGQNEERLKDIPHRPFLDLAVVYCVPVELEDGNTGVVAVTDALARGWQADEETLHACAEANTERLYPAQLMPLEEMIRSMVPGFDVPVPENGLSILRSCVGGGGAGAMLYRDSLREFAEKHGDFYIIPSSIHEVLLLPLSAQAHAGELADMVREVNETSVPVDEVLSDHIYLYHADTGTIDVLD